MNEFGIKIKYSRMDCGSFNKKVIPVVEDNSEFFISEQFVVTVFTI